MGIRSKGGRIPAGLEAPYHGGGVPVGWLLMFGQIVNIADYPRLFAAIGSVHGGDGVTNFAIPDSRGRATVGRDDMGGTPANRVTVGNSGINGAALGAVGGGENGTLDSSQIPAHAHKQIRLSGGSGGTSPAAATTSSSPLQMNDTASQGGGGAHSRMQPSIVANKMIKT